MDNLTKIFTAFELHNPDDIKACFENGIDPNQILDDKPLIYGLINMYSRGPMFKQCVIAFVDHGSQFEDKVLLAVLLDDATTLDCLLTADKNALTKKYS